jgi:hypothetical protein
MEAGRKTFASGGMWCRPRTPLRKSISSGIGSSLVTLSLIGFLHRSGFRFWLPGEPVKDFSTVPLPMCLRASVTKSVHSRMVEVGPGGLGRSPLQGSGIGLGSVD